MTYSHTADRESDVDYERDFSMRILTELPRDAPPLQLTINNEIFAFELLIIHY
ncbi:MAG: hypothetical protein F6K17_05975 [Okeania sp. SIO3C4]|nr:hypothetical protein [Okeania sp. SIO3B3]NER02211.1 hypothetical protein [Okeania sp. SIO3C4]